MNISNEMIEEILKDSIEKRIKEYSLKDMVKDEVTQFVTKKMEKISDTFIKEKINKSIEEVLSKEINTDNGWGDKKHYDNFEDMFKAKFNEKLNDTWEIKRVIERTVKEKMDLLIEKKSKELTTKIQDMVLAEMTKETEKK